MRINYDAIGKLAAEIGCRRDDLTALATKNDPFYAEVPWRKAAAEWFAGLWHDLGFKVGSHPRRLHYIIVSQSTAIPKPNGGPYQNTLDDWQYLVKASLAARYLRLLPDGALADHRNDPPIIVATNPGTSAPTVKALRTYGAGLEHDIPTGEVSPPFLWAEGLSVAQDFLVEVWVEKSTQNDILVPLSHRLGFNLVAGAGETSEVLARQTVERAASDGRPMRILYISDFDPGGRSMPVALARKIEFWLTESDLDLDIQLDPIVLTPEQCEHYRLPRTPLKETERRAAKFEARFGEGATELDALEAIYPGELKKIVTKEVGRYLDFSLGSRVREVEWKFDREIRAAQAEVLERYDLTSIAERHADLVENFRTEIEELEAETQRLWPTIARVLEANAPVFNPADLPKPKEADPREAPLFDSKRDYLNQIDHYRSWQGKGGAAS